MCAHAVPDSKKMRLKPTFHRIWKSKYVLYRFAPFVLFILQWEFFFSCCHYYWFFPSSVFFFHNSRRVFLLFIQFIIIYLYDLYDDIAFGFRDVSNVHFFSEYLFVAPSPQSYLACGCVWNVFSHCNWNIEYLQHIEIVSDTYLESVFVVCFSSSSPHWLTVPYTFDGWQNEENIIFLFVYFTLSKFISLFKRLALKII